LSTKRGHAAKSQSIEPTQSTTRKRDVFADQVSREPQAPVASDTVLIGATSITTPPFKLPTGGAAERTSKMRPFARRKAQKSPLVKAPKRDNYRNRHGRVTAIVPFSGVSKRQSISLVTRCVSGYGWDVRWRGHVAIGITVVRHGRARIGWGKVRGLQKDGAIAPVAGGGSNGAAGATNPVQGTGTHLTEAAF